MKNPNSPLVTGLVGLFLAASVSSAKLVIPTVTVADPGNAQDDTGLGRVDYTYEISTHEVTNAQYAAFLNAVAVQSDPYGVYNANMEINQGAEYSVKSGYADKPVRHVSFWSAARFANWLTNDQPTGSQGSGTTETGMYNLGGVANPDNSSVSRQLKFADGDRGVAITSVDEWYKAAYYDPTLNDGSGGYYDYPTQSNTEPTAEAPPGGPNSANFFGGPGEPTEVGAYPDSPSFYGTFDQGGNLDEWNDGVVDPGLRGLRGGTFKTIGDYLKSEFNPTFGTAPSNQYADTGFRVTSLTAIPEPSSYGIIFGLVGLAFALSRRRRRSGWPSR